MNPVNENIEVKRNPERQRYEIHLDGHVAELVYRIRENKYYLMHTWVPQDIGGRGVATALALSALKYGEENELETIIYCPFVKAFVERHPDWKNEFGSLP